MIPATLALVASDAVTLLVRLADPIPDDNDVKAGWGAFALFIGLFVVVGLLGWSLTKQLRKADDAKRRGVYGDEPEADPATKAEQQDA
ncbi:hypothetical protein [Nocardioides acrostichi]|uniref:Uncharacterized protein n=1 Tax=Nocardioides acrostichi TaxID=2784339 RepID=A0A930V489_9ACTN|nr:hypothetical protein [Nocardioides acrostichi]MBF4163561.1 hypothetical protein [Nocardioides acrostichi]